MASVTTSKESSRCIGCGRPLVDGRVFRISKGSIKKGSFFKDEEFGDMHEGCFQEAVGSPESVLREVRRLARQTDRKHRKP